MNRLVALVESHYQEMSFRLQALECSDLEQMDELSMRPDDDAMSILTVTAENSNARESAARLSTLRQFDFTEDLQRSWVYQRNQAFRESGFSLSTRSMFTGRWSCLSALSMAEVSQSPSLCCFEERLLGGS